MKKSKFVLLGLMLIFLLSFSVIFVPVGVKANSQADIWTAPEVAKSFVDIDGKGVRIFVERVFTDEEGNFDYARVRVPRNYYFEDGTEWLTSLNALVGSGYFDVGVADLMAYYLTEYGPDKLIPTADRSYFYFDPEEQKLMLEYRGDDYIGFWIEQYASSIGGNNDYEKGYDEGFNNGYDLGYYEGHNVGYETGYDEGYQEGIIVNHEAAYYEGYDTGYGAGYEVGYDDARPEMDILLITLIMFIVSVFVYIKFRLRWVLIATTLLWFVPIFLVENLFIKIFSTIMIIVTIVITFFNDREEEYE